MDFNRLIPELDVSNFARSLAFYTEVRGFQIEYDRPERQFAMLSCQGSQLMIEQANDVWKTAEREYPLGRGVNFQMLVDDVGVMLASVEAHGYPVMIGLEERWYRRSRQFVGQRGFLVMDPDGHLLRFAQPLGVKEI